MRPMQARSGRTGQLREMWSSFSSNRSALVGLFLLVALVVFIVVVPVVSGYGPNEINLGSAFAGPSFAHWLGTDQLGRDTLTRLAVGGQESLMLSAAATGLAVIVGVPLGLVSGYTRGKFDFGSQRLVELLMGVPSLVLAIAVVSVISDRTVGVILAAGLVGMPAYVRLARAATAGVVSEDYVQAARSLGARTPRLVRRYVFPNALGPILVQISFGLGQALLLITALGFLGVGINPPQAEWGALASDAVQYLGSDPLLEVLPGLAIMLVTLTTNLVGDGLRDALDPRSLQQDVGRRAQREIPVEVAPEALSVGR